MKLNDLYITKTDIRNYDIILFGARIFYAINMNRHVGIYEWNIGLGKLVSPKELGTDNIVEGTCVNPRFIPLPNGKLRLYVMYFEDEGLWPLRFVDLPFVK